MSDKASLFITVEVIYLAVALYLLAAMLTTIVLKFTKKTRTEHDKERFSIPDVLSVIYFLTAVVKFTFSLSKLISKEKANSNKSTEDCAKAERTYLLLHIIGVSAIALFYWITLHRFFKIPVLKSLTTNCLKWLRWLALAWLLASIVGAFVTTIAVDNRTSYVIKNGSSGACHYSGDFSTHQILTAAWWLSFGALQEFLVILFATLLCRHNASASGLGIGQGARTGMNAVVRNCCLAEAVSATSDVILLLATVFWLHRVLTQQELWVIWDLDFIVNITCTVFCFKTWRKTLW